MSMTDICKSQVDVRRIQEMALHMEPDDIAERLGIDVRQVMEIQRRNGSRRWIARCDRTGQKITAYTERGAYLRAQIAGFSDWTLYGEATGHDRG